MMDTSALVASLVGDHEHHRLARPHLRVDRALPAIVLAETFAQLRRTFGQSAASAAAILKPWTSLPDRVLPTTATAVTTIFARAAELDLGGSVHDALIAEVCRERAVRMYTLDGRQHRLALA
ncbi:MAG: PIN domain-containing protein, partial [Pseudonocardia sp.]|nr:PIN domain-containing protein [Pseudonocardia sp.]